MKDSIKLKGHGYFERRRKDGSVIDSWECDNLIVTAGLVQASKLLNGVSTDVFDVIAIGEGTTGATTGDTALESESKRALASVSYEATGKAVFEKTFDFDSAESYDITEAGVLNSESAGGEMLDRFTFTAKSVDVDTDLYVKVTITVA
jgi:hypothetical protein